MTPPKPEAFLASRAPVGVALDFVSFWRERSILSDVRLQLVHTNAASGEGSIASSKRWAEAKPGSNTLPHYQVDRNGAAAKFLPTDRKGVGNGTVNPGNSGWSALPAQDRAEITRFGNTANWSIVIETADLGFGPGKPGEANVFTPEQGETVATILAYEAITHQIPLVYPDAWHTPGTASHTEPFGYPFWTNARGKTCPGREKKVQMREWIMPRAIEIVVAWVAPTAPPTPPIPIPEEDDMNYLKQRSDGALFVISGSLATRVSVGVDTYHRLWNSGKYEDGNWIAESLLDAIPWVASEPG